MSEPKENKIKHFQSEENETDRDGNIFSKWKEDEVEDIGPLSHWKDEDGDNEDIDPFSHWKED